MSKKILVNQFLFDVNGYSLFFLVLAWCIFELIMTLFL